VAAFENPMLQNLTVDLRKYPEIRRALTTGEVVLVRDATTDPLYEEVRAGSSNGTEPIQTRSAIALRFSLPRFPRASSFSEPPRRTRRSTSRTSSSPNR